MINLFQRTIRINSSFDGISFRLAMKRKHRGAVDYVADKIRRQGWQSFEPPLPTAVAALSRQEKSCFLDIGANSGFYALIAQQMGCRVIYAYEPVDYIAEAMSTNASLTLKCPIDKLNDAGFRVIRKAVGSTPGHTTIYLPPQDHGLLETSASLNSTFKDRHDLVQDVEVTTVDHEYREHAWSTELNWIVKIDVESWEEQVLRGAENFIQDTRPVLICEILPRPGVQTACFSGLCARHRYAAYHLCSPNNITLVADDNFVRDATQGDWNYLFIAREKEDETLKVLTCAGLDVVV